MLQRRHSIGEGKEEEQTGSQAIVMEGSRMEGSRKAFPSRYLSKPEK